MEGNTGKIVLRLLELSTTERDMVGWSIASGSRKMNRRRGFSAYGEAPLRYITHCTVRGGGCVGSETRLFPTNTRY